MAEPPPPGPDQPLGPGQRRKSMAVFRKSVYGLGKMDDTGQEVIVESGPNQGKLSLLNQGNKGPDGMKMPGVIKAPGMEGEGIALQLEEAEVLPYESVFEWDIQDPVGYYVEDDKYTDLMTVFENDEIKTAVLDGMWRDRIKYQVLRRFTWPPPLFFKQVFFTRGYYEDYGSRPTVDIQWLHLEADRKRRQQEEKLRRAGENRMNLQLAMHSGLERKDSLSEFDPMVYKREVLVLSNIPQGTSKDELLKMYPKGIVELHDDGKGGLVATIRFKTFEDSREAYRKALKTKIKGKQISVRPLMHIEDLDRRDSLSQFDPLVYNRKILVIKDLQKGTTLEEMQKLFPGAVITMKDDGKGGQVAHVEYKTFEDARKGYKEGLDATLNGLSLNMRPILHIHDLGRKDSLSDFDPLVYKREVLTFKHLPKNATVEYFQKLFPNGIVEMVDDGEGNLEAEVEFKTFDDSRAAYKVAKAADLNGKELNVMPKLRPRGSLSLFDPRFYERTILTLRDLPKNTPIDVIKKMFPKGTVTMKDNGKGGVTAEIAFGNFTDARAAYRHALKSNINGKELKVIPKLKKDHQHDLQLLHKRKSKAPLAAVVTGQKTSLSEFDPLVYNRQILNIKSIPKDTPKAVLDQMFPTGAVELKPDGKGGFDAEIEFQNFQDARVAFKDALKQKIKGQAINILPIMRIPGSGLDDVDRGDVLYANPYMIKSKIQAHPLRSKDPPKGQKPKTTKRLNAYDPRNFDYQNLDITGIPVGTTRNELQKIFSPRGDIKSLEPDFSKPGKMIAVVSFKSKEDAMYSYIDNHEQLVQGGEMKLVPQKLEVKKPVVKGEVMPEVPKDLTMYNPLEYDYENLDVKRIPPGTNKAQLQQLFDKGKVVSLIPDPLNPKIMLGVVNFDSRDAAIADYKKANGKTLNGTQVVIVPQKFPEGGKKKKKSSVTVTEEVTYEVLKKPKKEKKPKKGAAESEASVAPTVEVVEEVTYEVLKKPKKEKKPKKGAAESEA